MGDRDKKTQYMTHEEIQDALLALLMVFDEFCRERGLRYSLYAGTLLGAVRHGGFIPWDDDVDVCMPRPDYEKLLEIRAGVPDGYSVITSADAPLVLPFAKFQQHGIRAQESVFEGEFDECLWIDVFPIDGEDPTNPNWQRRQIDIVGQIKRRARLSLDPMKGANPLWKKCGKWLYKKATLRKGTIERLDGSINNQLLSIPFEESSCVTSLTGCPAKPFYLDAASFCRFELMNFSGCEFPVMGCWDDYLSHVYGDYMKLPPEDQRATHGLRAWRV